MKTLLEKFKALPLSGQIEASKELHVEAYFLKKRIKEQKERIKNEGNHN